MAAGKNRCDNGVSTDAAAAGTWLRIWNRLTSQPTAPALSNSAATPNSAAPRPVRSTAVRALGTRPGRLGHHHDASEIMKRDRRSGALRAPSWVTADAVRNPAATIGLQLAVDIVRRPAICIACGQADVGLVRGNPGRHGHARGSAEARGETWR